MESLLLLVLLSEISRDFAGTQPSLLNGLHTLSLWRGVCTYVHLGRTPNTLSSPACYIRGCSEKLFRMKEGEETCCRYPYCIVIMWLPVPDTVNIRRITRFWVTVPAHTPRWTPSTKKLKSNSTQQQHMLAEHKNKKNVCM